MSGAAAMATRVTTTRATVVTVSTASEASSSCRRTLSTNTGIKVAAKMPPNNRS